MAVAVQFLLEVAMITVQARDASRTGGGFDRGTLHYTSAFITVEGLDNVLMYNDQQHRALISADSLMT